MCKKEQWDHLNKISINTYSLNKVNKIQLERKWETNIIMKNLQAIIVVTKKRDPNEEKIMAKN